LGVAAGPGPNARQGTKFQRWFVPPQFVNVMTSLPGAVPTPPTTCVRYVRIAMTPLAVSTVNGWFALPLHVQIMMLPPSSKFPLVSRAGAERP
jgi:hypothetical protein